jgi:hypothetical protein
MGSVSGPRLGVSGARWGRIASAVFLLGSTACGLFFSPGDYSEAVAGAEPDAAASGIDGAPSGIDAAPSEPDGDAAASGVTRVVLVAGRRETLPGETGTAYVLETFHTTVSEAGEIGPWTWDVSPPVAASWTRAVVFGGALWLQRGTTVHRADFDGRIESDWVELLPSDSLGYLYQRPWLADAGLLSAGGLSGATWLTNVYRAPFTDAGLGPWQDVAASALVTARGEVTLHRHGSFLYAIGGRTSQFIGQRGSDAVEVATIGADGLPGSFVATERLAVSDAGTVASHGVMLPLVASGAGHLFVIGGLMTAQVSSVTDVALAAKIDEATGMLGKWTTLPRFPTPIHSAAVFVIGSAIFVFGGATPTEISDAVMALAIHADGTFGTEWKRVASLPGPRASLVGVVY